MELFVANDQLDVSTAEQRPVVSALAKFWWGVRRRFAAVMPGWPIILSSFLILYIMFGTGQGRQAVRAVLSDTSPIYLNWPLLSAFLSIALHGIIVQGAFLTATSHQEDFNGEKLRLHRFQRWIAFLTALIVPGATIGFILWLDGRSVSDAERQIPINVLAATGGAIVFIAIVNAVLIRAFTRIRENSFGQIISIGGRYRQLVFVLFFGALVVGLVQQFWFGFLNALGPIALIVTAFTLIGSILGALVARIRKYNWPSLLFFLVLLAFFSSAYARFWPTGYHDFKTVKNSAEAIPTANAHAIEWLRDRNRIQKGQDEADATINAVIVLAEGGGIFAARNSAGMLTRLDLETCGDFYSNLYAMSGVSGGSVGLAAYLAARADGLIDNAEQCGGRFPSDAADKIHHFLGSDFLTPIASGLLFRDIPLRMLPFMEAFDNLPLVPDAEDRARMFEAEFARRWNELVCADSCEINRFEQDFLTVVKAAHDGTGQETDDGEVAQQTDNERASAAKKPTGPIILFNTTRVDDGQAEVVSNIIFDKVGIETDARPLYNVLDRLADEQKSIPIGTAAHISARFPLVSPTAILQIESQGGKKERHSYVDGGYLDNSGAITALRAIDELRLAAKDLDQEPACRDAKEDLAKFKKQLDARKQLKDIRQSLSEDSISEIDNTYTSVQNEYNTAEQAYARSCYAHRLNFVVLHFYSRSLESAQAAEKKANPKNFIQQVKHIFVVDSNEVGTHWFKEISNPFVAIVKARGARGQGAVEALCRSAIAEEGINAQKICREMQIHRKAIAAERIPGQPEPAQKGHWIEYDIPGTEKRDDVVSRKHVQGLNWVNAPIDIGEDPRSDEFVPLGWFLGPDSNRYMKDEEERRQDDICLNLSDAMKLGWACTFNTDDAGGEPALIAAE